MNGESSYRFTAARKQAQSGRKVRPSSITIDFHSHVLVPEAAAFVQPYLDLSAMPLAYFATADTQALNRLQEAKRHSHLTDVAVRLADMDAMGVDMQIVMPPPPQCYYTVPQEIGIRAARMINEGLAEFISRRPDRFSALGTVPMQAAAAATQELEYVISRLGFKGVEILTNVAERELSDPAYDPFWAKAEALGAIVLVHPNGFTAAERLRRFYFNHIVGNPLETTIALHYFIFDGVFDRHPNLKIIAVHGGGYLPAYHGRMDHAWGARPDCHSTLPQPPTTYLKRIYVDSVVFAPLQLAALVAFFGAGHVLMGTDYPYDMADYDPIAHLASLDSLDPADLAAIAGNNAKMLFAAEAASGSGTEEVATSPERSNEHVSRSDEESHAISGRN